MCGRYRLSSAGKVKLAQIFEAEHDLPPEEELAPRYNIAPTQVVAIVRELHGARHLSLLRWGLIPAWATDKAMGNNLINARCETVLEKASFRESFRQRRCLVPADGFYEWKAYGRTKQPYHFGMADAALFAFAGLWDRWRSPQGSWIETFSILTTQANDLLREFHERMPVILARGQYDTWLQTPAEAAKGLTDLMLPWDAASMQAYPVSTLVNRPGNDSPDCAERITLPEQASLGYTLGTPRGEQD